ncbi:MAG: cyclic nucleotide-binding domain-containing protein, partial [Magnetospirillum sp.]|nr:cyclic nucleotide-binding domain-containing protein [Magnetospirillum sp.]
ALLIGCAANERYAAGEHLFREGGEANKFFLIRAGTVAVEVDAPVKKAIVLETLGEGDVLGWSWMVPPYRTSFAARARDPVRALSFDAKCLRRKMEDDPALGYAVMRRFLPVMAHRLSAARLQMLDLYGPAVAEKPEKKPKAEKKAKKKAS